MSEVQIPMIACKIKDKRVLNFKKYIMTLIPIRENFLGGHLTSNSIILVLISQPISKSNLAAIPIK
jgi:hypothetical protein